MAEDLPTPVRNRAIRLGRRIHEAEDDAAAHRKALAALLEPYGFHYRVRETEGEAILVCYPREWSEEGTVQVEAIEDIDRAIELPLTGSGEENWATVAAANRRIAAAVRDEHGPVHGANAEAFTTFMNNHRGRPIAQATDGDIREFLKEYYPRNVWPSEEEAAHVEESVRLTRQRAQEEEPL